MPNNYIDPDDATQPVQPPYNNSSNQGKLVLGDFKNQPPQRQPYQYPNRQSASQPDAGQRAYTPPNQGRPADQYNQNNQYGQPPNRGAYPGNQGAPNAYPYQQQPGQMYGPNRGGRLPRRRRRNRGCQIGCLTLLVLLVIVVVLGVITIPKVLAFGSAISKQAPLSTSGDMSTNNRVNMLVLGYGGGGHDGAYLTDSMVVISLLPQNHHTSLVSVPRDLWVQNPYTTQSKINAVYTAASNSNQNPEAGGTATTGLVGTIIGMPVKYWMTINFTGFRELINSIGGIDVYVPNTFSANYPMNDDPAINAGWKVVHFDKGNHHMDGETAIEYARARYVTDNTAEASDFARSARQQIMIKATLSKMKQLTTWPSLFNALNALQQTIRTNMSLEDLARFGLAMDLNSAQTAHVGLSVDNVMAYGTSDDGQSIVVPQNNDWAAVAHYVQQHLYN